MAEADFSGSEYFTLIAIDHHPRIIRDFLFDDTVNYPAEAVGFDVWVSVVVIVVLAVLSALFVRMRYRRLA
jgi:hypothetical protein